eukprot:CAMPEP_0172942750 /NCGR_PEP_ID=MMETSP1075-20121228/225202_1 /TAXON_ID=2916 /ORGANISM="Ceratium fusus, Strain PA161109" /LENGTH=129 /DNA_ID=CAMNT_0013804173 /DNA_START=233 /DNA_END=622 /DNA_ORIENTATION=+
MEPSLPVMETGLRLLSSQVPCPRHTAVMLASGRGGVENTTLSKASSRLSQPEKAVPSSTLRTKRKGELRNVASAALEKRDIDAGRVSVASVMSVPGSFTKASASWVMLLLVPLARGTQCTKVSQRPWTS